MVKLAVTIGVCVKNCETHIKDAIKSIRAQDFPHERMEIIVVDGDSKDETISIIKDNLSGIDIKTRIFFENKGLGHARQIVVNNAVGDYIVWVDGDMVLSDDFVKKQVLFMEQNPDVGIAKGEFKINPKENLVALLESIAWRSMDSRNEGVLFKSARTKRLPETGGSIYRVKAIRQVGGFDENIKGSAEDADAAYRVREAGWKLYLGTTAMYYSKRARKWSALWHKYFWHGYGGHYILHKHRNIENIYEMTPPFSFMSGLLCSIVAYKLTHRKTVFLLPFQFVFKITAWFLGFIKGHIDGYGHPQSA